MSTYVALDPGVSTGWASWCSDCNASIASFIPVGSETSFKVGTHGPNEHHLELSVLLEILNPDIIICERFDNDGNKAALLTPVEYIGVVKLYTQEHKRKLVMQPRSARTIITDDWIKALKLGFPHHTPHSRDALRHLLRYLVINERLAQFVPDYTKAGRIT